MRNVMKGLALSAAAIAVIGGTISASAVPPTKDVHVDEGWFTLVFTDENDVTVPGCEALLGGDGFRARYGAHVLQQCRRGREGGPAGEDSSGRSRTP